MNKNIVLVLLMLTVVAIVGLPGALAFPGQTRACDGCHTISSSISVTTDITSIQVKPNEVFKVNITWSGGLAGTEGQTEVNWPTDFINIATQRNNSQFTISPQIPAPAPAGANGTTASNLTAPSAEGSYIIRVYTSAGSSSGPDGTNFKDINVTVKAVTPTPTETATVTPTATPTPTPTVTPIVTPGFSISGFKINDTNGNGVWDSGEMGIENWNIKLNNSATDEEIANTSTDATGFYQFTNLTPGSYNVTEEMKAGFIPTNTTSSLITIENMNVMNVNFTNRPVTLPVVTSFELIPGKTTELKGVPISMIIRAININVLETSFNGEANISITANNASAVNFSQTAKFTDGIAAIEVNSEIAQFVTVTATNASINGSTKVMFADKVFNLLMGWNLISIPNFADPSRVDQALQLVRNNGVVGFDPATNNFSTPTELLPLFGYWINVTADNQSIGFIASTNITSLPPSRKLYEGWNLIGISASRNDPDALNVSELFIELKFGPDPTQWLYTRLVSFEQPASPVTLVAGMDLSDSTALKQGHGYWLSIKSIPGTDKNNVPWLGKQW